MIPPVKVFVTGGTGFVGREVLWKLRGAGHSIRMLARDPNKDSTRQLAYRHGAEIIPGSTSDEHSLRKGMEGCHAVIHLVGIISQFGENTFQSVHVDATRNVIEAATETGIPRYLHMSALGTRPDAKSDYHRSKWDAEQLVTASSLEWTIFRPSVVFGRDDGFVNLLARICRLSPIVPIMGDGKNKLQPIAVEDVAHCFVGALSHPGSVGKVYDLCGDEVYTLNQIYRLILEVTHRYRPRIHIPMGIARVQAALLEAVFKSFGKPAPLTRDQLKMLQEDNTGDAERATAAFDFKPARFAEGIARYLR